MRITLVQTPWSQASAREFRNMSKRYASYPPLGLMYLAAFAEKSGHKVDIVDLEVAPMSLDDLCARMMAFETEMIGFTASTPAFYIVQAYAKAMKERLGLPIVVGGAHVTAVGEGALTEEFDFAIMREGEQALVDLLDAMKKGHDYAQIKGLIYRQGTATRVNPPQEFISDLDSLPFPARHLVDPHRYAFEVPGKGFVPVGTVELTRGCPFKCVFCSEPLNTGRKLRTRSPVRLVDEILEVREKFGIDHFFLLDSTLTVNRKLVETFCEELLRRNARITFEGQTRANLVDESLLVLMKRAGLIRLNFGLESADMEVLALMRKQVDPESVRTALRLCKNLGISTLCGVMMGNPGDTRKTILATARFVRSVPEIRYAPMAIAVPYPGTELYDMASKGVHGLKLIETDYRKFSRYAGGVMEVDGMKPAELIRLQRKALFIMHASPFKVWGVICHFGLVNLLRTAGKMLWNELVVLLGGAEPVLTSIEDDNTTLQSLGLVPAAQNAKGRISELAHRPAPANGIVGGQRPPLQQGNHASGPICSGDLRSPTGSFKTHKLGDAPNARRGTAGAP